MIDPLKSLLLTDLYQLTMLEAYFDHRMTGTAVFEFFIRRMPGERGFLLAAGLEQLLAYLESARFTDEELDWVSASGLFGKRFPEHLAALRFTGDVDAMPEGTVCCANEPLVRVVAPLPEAQLIETRLINILHFQTLIASKAVRCRMTAPGKLLVDFGLRRAHGAEAGLFAARASYLAGFAGSSNVAAAVEYGIPAYGTMAHSFVQAHLDERLAFKHFALTQPHNTTLLIDTYDTEAAAAKVVGLVPELEAQGIRIKAVRLDSGDLHSHAVKVRHILDRDGLRDIAIFCSSSLDEQVLHDLLARGAPIDGFGIGTHLVTSSDAPYLDCAYKLMEYEGRACRKRSEGKATLPGRKQVYRRYDSNGRMCGDLLTLIGDHAEGEPLLRRVMQEGKRSDPPEPLETIRRRVDAELSRLPEALQRIDAPGNYPVTVSPLLQALADSIDRETASQKTQSTPSTE